MHVLSKNEDSNSHIKTYILIWGILLALLVLSVMLGTLQNEIIGTILIFSIAVVKGGLVLWYYMNLNLAPKYIKIALPGALVCMIILFILIYPDIVTYFKNS